MSKVNLAIFFLVWSLADIACAQGPADAIVQKMEAACTRVCHGPSLIAQQRLDVAGLYGNPHYENSGFYLSISFAPGKHVLSLEVVTADGSGYYRGQETVEVTAK